MGAAMTTAVLTDHALLDRFLRDQDGEAFAELVRRHGSMVRATCVRQLGDTPDAEDACQAVFLVLVRRAGAVTRRERLGPWLYAVAVRTARKALELRRKRHGRERTVIPMPEPAHPPAEPRDWLPLLDDALQSLPARYREPLVLCELQGQSRAHAAAHLGLAEGTLSSRLARGRELLRQRLLRRGVSVSALTLATVLASQASAAVSPALIATLTQAALTGQAAAPVATLAEGVLHAMYVAKLKLFAAVALTLALLLGAAGLFAWSFAAQTPQGPAAAAEKEKMQGDWKLVDGGEIGRKVIPGKEIFAKGFAVTVKGDTIRLRHPAEFKIDPSKSPKQIDMVPTAGPEKDRGKTFRGIYELNGDDWRIALPAPSGARPRSFDEPGALLLVLKRVRVADAK